MNHHKMPATLLRISVCVAAFCAVRLAADVVETTNGARIVGNVTAIHGGVVTIDTDYAGEINVKQSLVTSITTAHPVEVKVAGGTRIQGTLSPARGGGLRIAGQAGSLVTPVDKVVETWPAGEVDPDAIAALRRWSYEAGVDINGATGTHTQAGEALTFHARLAGPDDTFQYFGNYIRQESDSKVSADQFKAGVDYADNFAPLMSWYARDEGGFDRVHDITFYDIAAGGYGFDFIKAKDQTLTGRAGISYRFDRYSAENSPSLSSAGADFELEYTKAFNKAHLHDKITFVPAFQNLNNYIITHEIAYEIPITRSLWKLSIGMTNDFDSKPVDDVQRLETLYFTRLVLSWGEGRSQH